MRGYRVGRTCQEEFTVTNVSMLERDPPGREAEMQSTHVYFIYLIMNLLETRIIIFHNLKRGYQ